MVLELHPSAMAPGFGFAALRDLCLVMADGCEAPHPILQLVTV
jgi:hypothetical protein